MPTWDANFMLCSEPIAVLNSLILKTLTTTNGTLQPNLHAIMMRRTMSFVLILHVS